MNYHKNDLIDECLVRYYTTFSHTLDTADYVPDKYNAKILKYIFKNMKRSFRKIDREDRRWQKEHKGDVPPVVDNSTQDEPQEAQDEQQQAVSSDT
ncbi:MAG: hypothetical protein K2N47_04830, partial [Clostridia bacterium]|nr:hypothetical protein [Clostridia bacterium]